MSDTWEPKPGDVVYDCTFDIAPGDDTLADPASYACLARVVIRLGDGQLAVVDMDGPSQPGLNLPNGEPHDGDDAVAVTAFPFDPDKHKPTLAAAIRRCAESDIEHYTECLAASRKALAVAERLEREGGAA